MILVKSAKFLRECVSKEKVHILLLLAAVLLSGEMFAQSTSQITIEEIIVTGSRIPRAGFETLQPATVLSNEEIELRGAVSIARMINELPGFSSPLTSSIGTQGVRNTGQNFANFLGMGSRRTLTLVNGQRFPAGFTPTGTGGLAVDLNAMPENLIERVETIAIGGAPIYGTDAIAGTLNIILKEDYEGLDITASVGQSMEYKDNEESRLGILWGKNFNNGRGNFALSLQAVTSNGLLGTDRPETGDLKRFERPLDRNSPYALVLQENLVAAGLPVNPAPLYTGNQNHFNIFGNGIPVDINDPASPLAQFDAQGNLIPYLPGERTSSPIRRIGGDGYDVGKVLSLNSDLERYNFTALGNYELNSDIKLKAELWFARTDATQLVTDAHLNSVAFGGLPTNGYGNVGSGPIPVLLDNPFLPEASRTALSAALNQRFDSDGDGIANPNIDTDGDGISDAVGFWRDGSLARVSNGFPANGSVRDTHRALVGLEGRTYIFDREFEWDLTFSYGRTRSKTEFLDFLNAEFDQAVQVVVDGNGNPGCADPSGGCAPLNVIGTPSAAAIDFVTTVSDDEITLEQRVISGNITGEVFDVPAGPVELAAGLMYREEEARITASAATAGLVRFPRTAIDGGFDTSEIFIEGLVPLLGGELDTPWVESLNFEGAMRYVDNSVAGEDLTWTAGLRFRPIDDIELRGNFTESIKAPSISELFTPQSTSFSSAADPCDSRFIAEGNFPDLRAANCAAAGSVQPFTSLISDRSIFGTTSGNLDLDNEVAKSSTVGMVIRPRFVPGLTLAVDWLNIEIENSIKTFTLRRLMESCFDSTDFPNEPSCARFQRDADQQVTDFQAGFVNVGFEKTTGVQTVMAYQTGLGELGRLSANLNYFHLDEDYEIAGSGNRQNTDGILGSARNRVTLNATWSIGDFTWFNQVRWLDSSTFFLNEDEFARDITGVDDWAVVNSTLSYAVNDNIDVRLTIDNLFDKKAPDHGTVFFNQGVRTYWSGYLGRYATVTLRASFE